MNTLFWIDIQKCWRRTTSEEEKKHLTEIATTSAEAWNTAKILHPYSNNPLDDFEVEDDEDD